MTKCEAFLLRSSLGEQFIEWGTTFAQQENQQKSSLLLQCCIAMSCMWLGPIGFICLFVNMVVRWQC